MGPNGTSCMQTVAISPQRPIAHPNCRLQCGRSFECLGWGHSVRRISRCRRIALFGSSIPPALKAELLRISARRQSRCVLSSGAIGYSRRVNLTCAPLMRPWPSQRHERSSHTLKPSIRICVRSNEEAESFCSITDGLKRLPANCGSPPGWFAFEYRPGHRRTQSRWCPAAWRTEME
jgi:hypothetical protein